MKKPSITFNIYLLLVTFFLTGSADVFAEQDKSETPAKAKAEKAPPKRNPKKEFATIRFHLETNLDGTAKTKAVEIYRANPMKIGVEEICFLDEGGLEQAFVAEVRGE